MPIECNDDTIKAKPLSVKTCGRSTNQRFNEKKFLISRRKINYNLRQKKKTFKRR